MKLPNLKLPASLKSKFNSLTANKLNLILIGALFLIIIGSVVGYNKLVNNNQATGSIDNEADCSAPLPNEIDLPFDQEGPYASLQPRRDGNALILDMKRVSTYDQIYYELAYQSDGINRGACGYIKKLSDKTKKSEYSQEILFGTCSKGDTFSILHCVFDPDVENGTLTIHAQVGGQNYHLTSTWHFQKPDVALGVLTSGDDHFTYKMTALRTDLVATGFTIINDLSASPKLPDNTQILGKVYNLNVPDARVLPTGTVSIELAEAPPTGSQVAYYVDSKNSWTMLTSKLKDNTLEASGSGAGIYTVLAPVAAK